MADLLNVPYRPQIADGYCLPACVQMALAYLGITRSQQELARTMEIFEGYGVPASRLLKLRTRQIQVVYKTEGNLVDIRTWLDRRAPIIAFVQTSQLDYWRKQMAQHAVLIVGMDEQTFYLQDPARTAQVIRVPLNQFLLAWDEMEFAFGVVAAR